MNKFYHSVYLKEEKCKGCITCLKRCPTNAIRVRNGKANIIKEFCIDCGECIRLCPHHAKQVKHDRIDVLSQFEYTVALPAPSLYSQFNNLTDINIILTALLQLGFDDVYEVSAAAEFVSEATRKYITEHKEQYPIISTACPTIERLIRVRFPNLISHLLPILPPVEVAAAMARKKACQETGLIASQIGIVFLSPCPSKVAFVQEPLGLSKSNIDAVLSVKDIYPALLAQMKTAQHNVKELSHSGKLGIGWGMSGGEAAGILSGAYLSADGIENVIDVLENIEDEKIPPEITFVELNSCNGGCVGGVLNVENPYVARTKMSLLKKYMPITKNHLSDPVLCGNVPLAWDKPVTYEPVYQLGSNMMETMANLSAVEKLAAEFPGLDCGSCGAPTCLALAKDIIMSKTSAKKEDCIYLLRDYYNTLKNSQLIKEE